MSKSYKYGRILSFTEEVARFRNSELTPLEIAVNIFGVEVSREQFDEVLNALADSGVPVKSDYAETLWSNR